MEGEGDKYSAVVIGGTGAVGMSVWLLASFLFSSLSRFSSSSRFCPSRCSREGPGEWVVRFLLRSDKCSAVVSYVRTPADFSDEVESRVKKLTQKIIDFDALANEPIPAGTQAAFCCLGLREPSKHSKEEFVAVDVGFFLFQ